MAKAARTGFRRDPALVFILLFAAMAVLAFLQTQLGAEDTPVSSAPRETAVCLDCHEDQGPSMAFTPHRLSADPEHPEAWVACSDCHPGDKRHYEEDPEEFPRTNPATLSAAALTELCTTCHMNSHQQNMLESNVHADNDVSCTDCHSLHGNSSNGLLKAEEPGLCLNCHVKVEGEFAMPFRHPVNDEIVKCSECHLTLDRTAKELSFNGTNVCTDCHMEFKGPFPFEHQATLDFSTDEGGCINCHAPHGSLLPRMLNQPYEAPDFQLCTQCHGRPAGHQYNFNHGDRWADMACNECHTDIHGSYTNRYFLSETLRGEGCLSAGCHGR